ncbi:hypothetical protein FACS1894160_4300 [Bacteroidia bacterium]|nr:hypothetical protein FACS1894160_4300 [Bacteroidia bacterium]
MKHAYLLLTHKNPTQLVQLISALQAENSYLFIHVDGKSTKVYNALQCLIELPRNVFICEERKNVSWGGFSQVEATMQLINMLVNSNINPDYVHLISGQDFPLKSASEIDNFFAQNNGKNFLNYFTLPCEHWARNGGLDRLLYTWNIDGGNGEKSEPTEPFPENIQPYGGSQWWSLTMDCINYLFETCR